MPSAQAASGVGEERALARYRAAACRQCRREGIKLFLKGSRCFGEKCAIERRNYPPGQHGLSRTKPTNYGIQLREKQKAKRIYGVLESQFRRYFHMAERERGGTGENLLKLLERRLDNVIYRMGFGTSRAQSRQLVRHGHVQVNGDYVESWQPQPMSALALAQAAGLRCERSPPLAGTADPGSVDIEGLPRQS